MDWIKSGKDWFLCDRDSHRIIKHSSTEFSVWRFGVGGSYLKLGEYKTLQLAKKSINLKELER